MAAVTAKTIPAPRADVKAWQLMAGTAVPIRRRLTEAVPQPARQTIRPVLFRDAANQPVGGVPIAIHISVNTEGARTMAWMMAIVLLMRRRAIPPSATPETALLAIKRLVALAVVLPLQSNV